MMIGHSCGQSIPAPATPPYRNHREVLRVVTRRGGWILVHLVVVGLVAECAARAYAKVTGRERILRADRLLGWRLVPGVEKFHADEERPYRIQVNSEGLRDRERDLRRHPGVRRVVVLGDSYVFGAGGVDRDETFVARLERMVPAVEFINLGMFGYSTDQQYLYLREVGLRYRPDCVLLCIAPSDIEQCFSSYADRIGRPKGYLAEDHHGIVLHEVPELFWWDRMTERSYLAALMDRRMQWSQSWYRRHRLMSEGTPESRLATMHRLLNMFRELSAAGGAEFIVAFMPERVTTPSAPSSATLCRMARAEGHIAIDLSSEGAFARAEDIGHLYFNKDIHLNPAGHAEVAGLLARRFLQQVAAVPEAVGP